MSEQEPAQTQAAPPRTGRWLAVLLLLPLLLVLTAVVAAWMLGLRVQGPGWRQGPALALWQLHQGDCLALQGDGLVITGWRPLRIRLDQLAVHSCPPAGELTPPPWTPAFDLHVTQLQAAGLPPLRLDVQQREQRWQAVAHHGGSRIQVDYQRADGRWRLAGDLLAADWRADVLGRLALSADGVWRADRLDGRATLRGQGLGQRGRPQRADAVLTAMLHDDAWTLAADLSSPLALAAGWRLSAHKGLSARGDAGGVRELSADLLAEGPQGQARLRLTGEAGARHGAGELMLSGRELSGRLPLRWTRETVTLASATLGLPRDVSLTLPQPVTIPLAATGRVSLPLSLRRQSLTLSLPASVLSWGAGSEGQAGWGWQGMVTLSGRQSGLMLDGRWQGGAGPDGLAGEPLRLRLSGKDMHLAVTLPVAGLRAPDWPLRAAVEGRYGAYPLRGDLRARQQQGIWQGELRARSRLAVYDKGGELDLKLPWLLHDGVIQAQPGARLGIAQGLKGSLLIKPLTLTARTPLRLADGGVRGELALSGEGLVAARAGLPALTGDIRLAGHQARAQLSLPGWQSRLDVDAVLTDAGAQGRAALDTPLSAAMSQGLGFTLRQGRAQVEADWVWQGGAASARGVARVSDLGLDWGGIKAAGGQGRLRFSHDGSQSTLASEGPLTLATLDVGTPITRLSLGLAGDLSSWRLSDVSAEVLGGRVTAPALHWPAGDYQTITLAGLDLARVVALQGQDNPPVSLSGTVGGELPVQLGRTTLALRQGQLRNEVPLTLRILPSAGVQAMSQSNRAVQLAMDTLSHMLVSDFRARLDMAPDGWLDAAVTLRGDSVQPNRQPVVLNYTHRENVLELLRSLRIGDEISQQVMDRQKLAP